MPRQLRYGGGNYLAFLGKLWEHIIRASGQQARIRIFSGSLKNSEGRKTSPPVGSKTHVVSKLLSWKVKQQSQLMIATGAPRYSKRFHINFEDVGWGFEALFARLAYLFLAVNVENIHRG